MERELVENPPVDRLVQLYFVAQKWMAPPRTPFAGAAAEDDDDGVWECPYPDVTE